MRALGLDYGAKRVGVAVSDESFTLARELGIFSPQELLEVLPELVREHEVSTLVLGWPLNMSGQETEKTREVRAFAQRLEEAVRLPVEPVDERLTTVMAHRLPGGATRTDSLAAQIILQVWLDKKRG